MEPSCRRRISRLTRHLSPAPCGVWDKPTDKKDSQDRVSRLDEWSNGSVPPRRSPFAIPPPAAQSLEPVAIEGPWGKEISRLLRSKELAKGCGGEVAIEKQHGKGRLTVRERIDLLLDEALTKPPS